MSRPRPAVLPERAVIGDQLRRPIARCEAGNCGSHYADPDALGEADARARAIAAGWREDTLGRLACPTCQQREGLFWLPPAPAPAGWQTAPRGWQQQPGAGRHPG